MAPPRSQGATWQQLRIGKQAPLLPGNNRLEITVVDANGLSHSQRLNVTYKPEEERKPNLYVAVVATAEYQNSGLANLPLTQDDARVIATTFEQQKGKRFNKVAIAYMVPSGSLFIPADAAEVGSRIAGFPVNAQDGDYMVVYVSGHGLKLGNEYYMVPQDGDPKLRSTLVAWSRIRDWLSSAPLERK